MGPKFDNATAGRLGYRADVDLSIRTTLFGRPVAISGAVLDADGMEGWPAKTEWFSGPFGGKIPMYRPAGMEMSFWWYTGDPEYASPKSFLPSNIRRGRITLSRMLPARFVGSFDVDGPGPQRPVAAADTREVANDVFEFSAGMYRIRLALVGEPYDPSVPPPQPH